MKRYLLPTVAALLLVLSGCSDTSAEHPEDPAQSGPATASGEAATFLSEHDLAGMDGADIVDHLDRVAVTERPTDLMASVRADQLLLADAEQEIAVDLPEDRFYLSVAPYVDQTHECFYHSLTTCRGELAGQELNVRIVDDDGEVLIDEQVTTFDNGFAGFWLPRGTEGTVEATYDGRTGQTEFSTTEEGATCLTDLQLTQA